MHIGANILDSGGMAGFVSQKNQPTGLSMVRGLNDRMAGSMPVIGMGEGAFAAKLAGLVESQAAKAQNMYEMDSQGSTIPQSGADPVQDFIDVINPLQHIPIVSAVYQQVTGNHISAAAEIIGGGLFGGPIGAVIGAAAALVKRVIDAPEETMRVEQTDSASKSGVGTAAKVKAYPDTTIALANLRLGFTPYNS